MLRTVFSFIGAFYLGKVFFEFAYSEGYDKAKEENMKNVTNETV